RAHAGDATEVSELLEAYRNYLRILGRDGIKGALRAKVDASDVVQEVMLAAQGSFGQFRGSTEAELVGWLRTILAREIVRHARKHGRPLRERPVTALLEESDLSLGHLAQAGAGTPSEHAHRREVSVIVSDALCSLTGSQREAILLRTREDLSWQEVAERMGKSADAVRQLWVRGLQALRPLLKEHP
ncbi:MAG: sigma-70 family RNA polymerase sigma factor, partial [Planctomycetota bacterium]